MTLQSPHLALRALGKQPEGQRNVRCWAEDQGLFVAHSRLMRSTWDRPRRGVEQGQVRVDLGRSNCGQSGAFGRWRHPGKSTYYEAVSRRGECDLRYLLLIAALLAAGPALAVPPVGPRKAEAAVVEAYAAALERNDLPAFRSLIADDATIVDGAGKVIDKNDWLATAGVDFPRTRRTRILSAFSGYAPVPGQVTRRFVLVIEFTRCHPNAVECFPRWRTETITIAADRIIQLQTSSDFDLRRSGAGVWTFYD